jgi:hypothetical protein
MGELFYRYEWVLDHITLHEYLIIKSTPQGYWIKLFNNFYEKRRWMAKDAKKRFAHKSKKEALESFIKRKRYYAIILKKRRQDALYSIVKAEQLLKEMK